MNKFELEKKLECINVNIENAMSILSDLLKERNEIELELKKLEDIKYDIVSKETPPDMAQYTSLVDIGDDIFNWYIFYR